MRLRFRPLRERLDRFAPRRPGRVFGGRRAVAGGQRAEDLIQWVLRRLDEQGLAWIKKTEPPTGIDAKGRRFFKRKGAPDFMGALPGGRHIVFEAKSTREPTFRWPEGTHQTRERQIADLERAGGVYGALAGVLVVFWPSAAQGRSDANGGEAEISRARQSRYPGAAGGEASAQTLGRAAAPPPRFSRLVWVHWAGARYLAGRAWSAGDLCEQMWAAEVQWSPGGDPEILDAALSAEHQWQSATDVDRLLQQP